MNASPAINLCILHIHYTRNVSGVDRHIDSLVHGLQAYPEVSVTWLNLERDRSLLFRKQHKQGNCTKITLPLPQDASNITAEDFRSEAYYAFVHTLLGKVVNNWRNTVVSVQTLDLIDLAIYLRQKTGSKIAVTLHCIPWKYWYDSNPAKFNRLYATYLKKDTPPIREEYLTTPVERRAYEQADAIIALTGEAERFLTEIMGVRPDKIASLRNGLPEENDRASTALPSNRPRQEKETATEKEQSISTTEKTKNTKTRNISNEFSHKNKEIQIIFIGTTASKGILHALKALQKVSEAGHNVLLHLAGPVNDVFKSYLNRYFPNVRVHALGIVPYRRLKQYYSRCDIGLIASLHEQCSYAAIEMAMFALPIVATRTAGLSEMFRQGNALTVPLVFSPEQGLHPDENVMAAQLISLITSPEQRRTLGKQARKLYETRYQANSMTETVLSILYELSNKP